MAVSPVPGALMGVSPVSPVVEKWYNNNRIWVAVSVAQVVVSSVSGA